MLWAQAARSNIATARPAGPTSDLDPASDRDSRGDQRIPECRPLWASQVRCRERLGGLLRYLPVRGLSLGAVFGHHYAVAGGRWARRVGWYPGGPDGASR
jgi:hypothetical protein